MDYYTTHVHDYRLYYDADGTDTDDGQPGYVLDKWDPAWFKDEGTCEQYGPQWLRVFVDDTSILPSFAGPDAAAVNRDTLTSLLERKHLGKRRVTYEGDGRLRIMQVSFTYCPDRE